MDIYISKRFINIRTQKKRLHRWRIKEPPHLHTQDAQNNFSPVPDDVIQWTLLKYFKQFWSDEITDLLVNQTNLNSVQKTRSSINTNHAEIEQIIGIQMLMSVVKIFLDTKCIGIAKLRMSRLHQHHRLNNTKRPVNFYVWLTIQEKTNQKIKAINVSK